MAERNGALGVRRDRLGDRARSAAISLFLGTAAASALMVPVVYAQSYSFSTIRVVGNQYVDTATISTYAGISQGRTVSAGQLNDAYQRIMNSGLFESVDLEPQGSTLVVRVTEYPMINRIAFEGNQRIKDEQIAEAVQSKARHVYSPSQAEQDAAAITDLYRNAGRVAAIVEPKIIRRSDNRVDLVFEVREGGVVEIERISFSGNRSFSEGRLRQVLATKQAGLLRRLISSDSYVEDRVEFDKQLLTDFYRSRGFADFQVLSATSEFSRDRNAFFLNFNLREGPRYTVGRVSVGTDLPDISVPEFQEALRMSSGGYYNPTEIDANITRLERLALQKGMNFVRVEPRLTRDPQNGILNVEFFVNRGPRVFVERIDIEGNQTTLDRVVRRQFRVVEGDPYNPREIRQTAERIRALGYFSDVQANARPGSTPEQVIVDVDVVEQPTGSLSFGVSYGVDSGAGFSVGLSESNFLGRGQTVALNLSSGTEDTNTSFTFIEPFFLDRDLRLRFNLYYNRGSTSNRIHYNTQRAGIVPSIEFPISEQGRLELRYRLSRDKLTNVPYGDPAANGDPTINNTGSSMILHREEDEGALITSAVGYTYKFDNRTTGLTPNRGVYFQFGQDFLGVGGDVKAITTTALLGAEMKVMNEDVTLRAEVEGGNIHMLSGQDSRVTDRFFLRGKMRGFESSGLGPRDLSVSNEDALGGNIFAVARLEAEFPLGLPQEYGISGGLFWDVGSVWSLDDTQGGPYYGSCPIASCEVDDSLHWRSAVGFSVFWTSPLGPLRFNFSKALVKEDYDREQNFDFTVSTRF
ncbi:MULTISPECIES: outer membrane protein assembly factor BamA [unclassified Haematobacter]|uniref:outer membrane protein assembly factor BamA n=1 Tax=unclassified Haematobacter TaxID=2640585 RepID=UPI0025BC8C72|nr:MULTISPECIES: outer membrane protein assembly factor BamA [unclassified Haematobacter]